MERTSSCDPSLAVFSLMAEYHDLASREPPAGRDRSMRTRLIEELLAEHPQRGDAIPARLELHRPVRLSSAKREAVGATLAVTIESVEIALGSGGARAFDLRAPVVLSIQTGWPKVWWRFLGGVAHVGARGRTVSVRLLRSLGCTSKVAPFEPELEALLGRRRAELPQRSPALAYLPALSY